MKGRSSPEERIVAFARSRAIDDGEARGLLDAVRPTPSRNPFARWGGETMAIVGGLVALLGLVASRCGAHFDGALDLHLGKAPSLAVAAVHELVAFPLAALAIWGVARAFQARPRLVDVLGVVGAARLPAVLFAIPLGLLYQRLIGSEDPIALAFRGSPALVVIGLASVAASALHVTLFVLGFRVATGLRGARLATSIVVALVVAEIVTKLALFFVR